VKYSIVIPAYKEAKIIKSSLLKLEEFLYSSKTFDETEVIVVAAESDETAEIVKSMSSKFKSLVLVEPGNKVGKGRDVRLGVLKAKGEFVLFTDADLATPAHHIVDAWRSLEDGADIVIGTRNLAKIHRGYRVPLSVVANWLTRLLVLPGLTDTQCGFKAFSSDATKACFDDLETMGWGFDFEILVRARQNKLRITQLPIPDWDDPKLAEGLAGESGITATIDTLKELYRVRRKLGKTRE
jgi:dolichyl-phosphate beta-glucosyltransferase